MRSNILRKGGEIVLGLQELSAVIPQRSQYVFTVSDNGPGLSEELLRKFLICLNVVKTAVQVNRGDWTGAGNLQEPDKFDGRHYRSRQQAGRRRKVYLNAAAALAGR